MIFFDNFIGYRNRVNSINDWFANNGIKSIHGSYSNPKNSRLGTYVLTMNKRFLIFDNAQFLDFIKNDLLAVKHTIGKDSEQSIYAIYDLYENQYCYIKAYPTIDVANINNIIYKNQKLPLLQLAKLISESKKK